MTNRQQLDILNYEYNELKSKYSEFITHFHTISPNLKKIGITEFEIKENEANFKFLDIEMGINMTLVRNKVKYYGQLNLFRIEKKAWIDKVIINKCYLDTLGNISIDNLKAFVFNCNDVNDVNKIIRKLLNQFVNSDYLSM